MVSTLPVTRGLTKASLSTFLLFLYVAFTNSVWAGPETDQLKIMTCATQYADAQGQYERYTNSRGEWVSYSNKPVYRYQGGTKSYKIYYRADSSQWVMDRDAIDTTSNGVISSGSQAGVEHPTETPWTTCFVLPNRIQVTHPSNANANGTYVANGINKNLPIYVKGTWRVYFHGDNQFWILDKDALNNTNVSGMVAKTNKNVKSPILATWNNSVSVNTLYDTSSYWHSTPTLQNGDCTQVTTTGEWQSANCSTVLPFACYNSNSKQWQLTQSSGTWFRGAYYCKKEYGATSQYIAPVNEDDNFALRSVLSKKVWMNFNDLESEGNWTQWDNRNFWDLLENPRGNNGNLSGWQISEKQKWSVELSEGHTNFAVTTTPAADGSPTTRTQTIDLIAKGWTVEELDTLPPLFIEQHYKINPGNTAEACLSIEMLNSAGAVLYAWGDGSNNCIGPITNNGTTSLSKSLSHHFDQYPQGVRKIRWTDKIFRAQNLALGNAVVSLYHGDATASTPPPRQLSDIGNQPNKLNSLDVTITTGADGTNQTIYFTMHSVISDYALDTWGDDFAPNSTWTYPISGVPKITLEDKQYTGRLDIEGQYFGSDSWDLKQISIKLNGVDVFQEMPNLKLVPYNFFTQNGGTHYSFAFSLPSEIRAQVVPELADAKAAIESGIQSASGLASYALSQDETNELVAIYDRYKPQYELHRNNPAQLSSLKQDAQNEYLQRIAYFQIDRLWRHYYDRLVYDVEQIRFSRFRQKLEESVLLRNMTKDEYVELAATIENYLMIEYNTMVRQRHCKITNSACERGVTAEEIHHGLYWSDLVYQSQADIQAKIRNGLDSDNVFSAGQAYYVDYDGSWGDTSSQAFVAKLTEASGVDDIVIAFRGTYSLGDFATDINFTQVTNEQFPNSKLKVHRGFQSMWNYHRDELITQLDNILANNAIDNVKTIYIVGHSLGAGVATISAPYLAHYLEKNYKLKDAARIKVITFGSPRTGNLDWANHVDSMDEYFAMARVWNYMDFFQTIPWESQNYFHVESSIPLPKLPPEGGYTKSWPTDWFSKEKAGDILNWIYQTYASWSSNMPVEGAEVKSHGTDAYKFNVDRYLPLLPVEEAHAGQPENCIAYHPTGKLMDEPCERNYPFLCENLTDIILNSGVGKNSVIWQNQWTITSTQDVWKNHWAKCAAGTVFSAPSRQSDLTAINTILNGRTVWVNFIRKPLN